MSENNTFGLKRNLDLLEGLVGLIFIIFVVTVAIISSDNRDDYYSDNPDLVPGTLLFIGLMIMVPLFFYGIWLFAKGVIALGWEILERTTDVNAESN